MSNGNPAEAYWKEKIEAVRKNWELDRNFFTAHMRAMEDCMNCGSDVADEFKQVVINAFNAGMKCGEHQSRKYYQEIINNIRGN